jgi:hypothetical protein
MKRFANLKQSFNWRGHAVATKQIRVNSENNNRQFASKLALVSLGLAALLASNEDFKSVKYLPSLVRADAEVVAEQETPVEETIENSDNGGDSENGDIE